jgi:biotin operon repressor
MQMKRLIGLATLALAAGLSGPVAVAAENDWMDRVGEALGKPGTEMPGGIYRVGLPRTDLHVAANGVDIKPGFALGGWLAFKKMDAKDVMVMGDLVLLEAEINPVMKKLIENGVEITAVHNHLLGAQPNPLYMHVLGHGDPSKLAGALHAALMESRTPLQGAASGSRSQPAAAQPPSLDLDTAAIDQALGRKGKNNGGIYQVSVPRVEPVKDHGIEVPEAMGSATAINFQPTGGGKAAITGDFVMVAEEVNPVIKALRANGIEVTALHSHMLTDQPRLFFMHFWANDDATKLAKGLRAALDNMKVAKS